MFFLPSKSSISNNNNEKECQCQKERYWVSTFYSTCKMSTVTKNVRTKCKCLKHENDKTCTVKDTVINVKPQLHRFVPLYSVHRFLYLFTVVAVISTATNTGLISDAFLTVYQCGAKCVTFFSSFVRNDSSAVQEDCKS